MQLLFTAALFAKWWSIAILRVYTVKDDYRNSIQVRNTYYSCATISQAAGVFTLLVSHSANFIIHLLQTNMVFNAYGNVTLKSG